MRPGSIGRSGAIGRLEREGAIARPVSEIKTNIADLGRVFDVHFW
jgi:hypothetical protein